MPDENHTAEWESIADDLASAHTDIASALEQMNRMGGVEHIADNLEPVMDSVARFRDLARDKAGRVG